MNEELGREPKFEPSEEQEKQFKLLEEIIVRFKAENIRYVIAGGYGLDGLHGELTRDHMDFDICVAAEHEGKVVVILQELGFKKTQNKDFGQVLKNESGLKIDLATSKIIKKLTETPESSFFPEQDNAIISGVSFRAFPIEVREEADEIRNKRLQEKQFEYPHNEANKVLIEGIKKKKINN